MSKRSAAAGLVTLALIGCGSTRPPSVEEEFAHGIEQIRESHGAKGLHIQLVQTITRLRRLPSASGRRLAIEGFASTLQGVDAQVDLIENDSGKLEAAVRDAARADRYRMRGATLLRAAGRVLGITVGNLGGY